MYFDEKEGDKKENKEGDKNRDNIISSIRRKKNNLTLQPTKPNNERKNSFPRIFFQEQQLDTISKKRSKINDAIEKSKLY